MSETTNGTTDTGPFRTADSPTRVRDEMRIATRRAFLGRMTTAAAFSAAAWPLRSAAVLDLGLLDSSPSDSGLDSVARTQAPAVQRAAAGKATDIRLDEVTFAYEEHRYRTPLKFGGTLTDRVTLLNVQVVVSSKNGKSARGFGSMPMGNVWSWPSRTLSYDQTLEAMKALAGRIRDLTAAHRA